MAESPDVVLKESRFAVTIDDPNEGRPLSFPILDTGFGGCGKAAILTDRRTVLSLVASAATVCDATLLTVGTVGVDDECWAGTGSAVLEGVLSFEGVCGAEGTRIARGEGRLFRVFGAGSGGRAVVGGSLGGASALGNVEFIAA